MELSTLTDSQRNQHGKHLLLCLQYLTPDDGKQICPKHDMIYLTAIGQPPGGSSTVHIYTKIHRTTQTIHRTTQFTNWEECGPCPVFARYTLAFALQLRKKHGKPSDCSLMTHDNILLNISIVLAIVHSLKQVYIRYKAKVTFRELAIVPSFYTCR